MGNFFLIPAWSFSALAKAPALFKITGIETTVLTVHWQQVENDSEFTQARQIHVYVDQTTLNS